MLFWKPKKITEDEQFKKHCRKNNIGKETVSPLKEVLMKGSHDLFVQNSASKKIWGSSCGKIQIFYMRIALKEKGKKSGLSSGCRLIITYIKHNNEAILEAIYKRSDLEKRLVKSGMQNLIKNLKSYYEISLENEK